MWKPDAPAVTAASSNGNTTLLVGWYIALAMMGLATSIAYGGTRYVNRLRRLPLSVVVQRSREFFRW